MQCSTGFPASHPPLPTWPLREWQRQVQILYPHSTERQQPAILEHIGIIHACTMSPARWLWLAEISSRLAEEVPHVL